MHTQQQHIMDMLNQGAAALNSGNLNAAERHLNIVLKLVPDEPNALFLMGGVKKLEGKHVEALKLMNSALSSHSNPAQIHNSIGNIHQQQSNIADALHSYNAAISCNPKYAEAFFNRGLLYHANENYDEAAESLEAASRLSPNNPALLNALGTTYKKLAKFNEAEGAFKAAIRLEPTYVKALNNLGALLRKRYRFKEAIDVLERAVQLAPKTIEPRFILANIHYELGHFDKADEQYRTIIAIQPDYVDAHVSLNRMYWEHGKSELYGKSYIVGIKACPNSAELCEQHLLALEKVGRLDEALDHAFAYLEEFPKHAGLYQKTARLHSFSGQADLANSFYDSALAIEPDNTGIRLDAGKLMLEMGEYNRAHKHLDAAENHEPDNQRLWAYRSLCWRMQNDERHEWLNDYDQLITPAIIEAPKGFTTTTDFLNALKDDLKKYHTTAQAPVDQTLRGGSQTHGMLFDRPDETIQLLRKALMLPINEFISGLPRKDNTHPFYRRLTGAAKFATSWSIWLRKGGFHVNHIHTMGWVSSSFYVDTPCNNPEQDRQHEGWIKFGESGLNLGDQDAPVKFIKPQPGMLVLFPSYTWHGTVAYHSAEDRITTPFDLLPE